MEQWKEIQRLAWKPDNKEESTFARILVSNTGKVKRLQYKRWSKKNNSYSNWKDVFFSNADTDQYAAWKKHTPPEEPKVKKNKLEETKLEEPKVENNLIYENDTRINLTFNN